MGDSNHFGDNMNSKVIKVEEDLEDGLSAEEMISKGNGLTYK